MWPKTQIHKIRAAIKNGSLGMTGGKFKVMSSFREIREAKVLSFLKMNWSNNGK